MKQIISEKPDRASVLGVSETKMRPSRQKEVITSHVHDLENVNKKLDVLRDSVTKAIQRAVFWLEERDEASYLQMKQYLLERNSRFLQTCIDIASDNDVTEESLREECEDIKSSSQPKVQGHKINSMDLSRIEDLENHFRTFHEYFEGSEKKLSRLNEQFETSSKTLLKKIKQLEKKHTEQQKHIQDISQKQVNEETKYNSSFNACSKELHQASEFIKFKTDSLSQKLNQCEERNEIIQKKLKETDNNLKTEIDTLTKQIQSCNDLITTKTEIIFGNSNENNNEIMKMCESNKEKEKKFDQILRTQDEMKTTLNQTSEHIEKELGSAKSRLESLESKNETSQIKLNELGRNVKDLPKKVQKLNKEMDNVLTTVATTLSSNDSEIQTLNKSVTEMATTINEMKSSNGTNISNLQSTILNISKQVSLTNSSSNSNITKLERQVEDLNCKVLGFSNDIVNLRASNEAEAFCLEVANMKETDIKKDTILTLFNRVGNVALSPHYNMSTSTYTVPHDGVYLCCLMVENLTNMFVQFNVYYKDTSGKESPRVYSQAYHKDLTSCSVIPIYMYKGDQLYIKSLVDYPRLKLGNNSFFSCILIK